MKTNPLLKELNLTATKVKKVQDNTKEEEEKKTLEKARKMLRNRQDREIKIIMEKLPEVLRKAAAAGDFSCVVFDTTGYCKDGFFYELEGSLADDREHNHKFPEDLQKCLKRDGGALVIHLSRQQTDFVSCNELVENLEKSLKSAGYPFKRKDVKRDVGYNNYEDIQTIGYEIIIEWPENS